MEYIFGPVNSRRLGLSLGLDLLPAKICNYNCIYCEVGPTTRLVSQRAEYSPTALIKSEFDRFCLDKPALNRLDVITITASGEPALHSGLGEIISHIKTRTDKPVAVLSNGSLFFRPDVRAEMMLADIVIPSLDSAREESFRRVDRPAKDCELAQIVEGLRYFCSEFSGKCWLEVLLVKGINDGEEDLLALIEAIEKINPQRLQLNTVARPPLEGFALPLDINELREVAKRFTIPVDILTDARPAADEQEKGGREKKETLQEDQQALLSLLNRRPCPLADLITALGIPKSRAQAALATLERKGQVRRKEHRGQEYFLVT